MSFLAAKPTLLLPPLHFLMLVVSSQSLRAGYAQRSQNGYGARSELFVHHTVHVREMRVEQESRCKKYGIAYKQAVPYSFLHYLSFANVQAILSYNHLLTTLDINARSQV